MSESPSCRQTDRQTKGHEQRQAKQERTSKRRIKNERERKKLLASETMTFLRELLQYQGGGEKKRERVEIIKNASEIMHFSDSIHHCFGTLDPLREVSEWREGARAWAPAPAAKEEDG